jgi:endonuclease/exonuclease/phosphatase (EEP) superfamily protein YafD
MNSRHIHKLWLTLAILIAVTFFIVSSLFAVPQVTELKKLTMTPRNLVLVKHCHHVPASHQHEFVDESGSLKVLVWNIYKQNRGDWSQGLNRFSQDATLLMLQEVADNDGFRHWLTNAGWQGYQVAAFSYRDVDNGVLTAAKNKANDVCAFTSPEPWLRLPKSSLVTYHNLSDGRTLAVANLHAINFSLGLQAYRQQLEQVQAILDKHQGPIIFAGDFNSWNGQREHVMKGVMQALSLNEVSFSHDVRKRFVTGYALDHIYYRGLKIEEAEVLSTTASDHNPLKVMFTLN